MEIATISSILTPLALLACPVGMGVMMWVMARSGKSKPDAPQHEQGAVVPAKPASLEVLREEHQRLSAAIDDLEKRSPTEQRVPR